MGETPLKETYSNIFRLALEPHASVANYFDINRYWDPRLSRAPNDWENGELISLLENGWNWNHNRKGYFISKSFYAV